MTRDRRSLEPLDPGCFSPLVRARVQALVNAVSLLFSRFACSVRKDFCTYFLVGCRADQSSTVSNPQYCQPTYATDLASRLDCSVLTSMTRPR